MIISLNWLSHWVDLSSIELDELVETLSVSGLEVASVQQLGVGQEKIVVGKILEIEPHPKADRLVVCKVSTGGETPRTIVCGATNMKAGDCVPVALPSSQPPGIDFEIGERKVMGVLSSGMLCAKEELALAESSDGLWILPPELEESLGLPIFEAMSISDTLLEIEVTPNRPDALSHRGVARDIAALFHRKLSTLDERLARLPCFSKIEGKAQSSAELPTVTITTDSPVHYAISPIDNLHVTDSPEWLQLAMAKVGLRPVNNVVDFTNFVMFDIGQPLHAFDAQKTGNRIVVRNANENETFQALNHKEYKLSSKDLLISNLHSDPLALAGVMGGESSEVTAETSNILLECAYFCPTSVRKTAKRHAIHSDASHRYERGMDPFAVTENLRYALKFASHLFGFKADYEKITVGHNLSTLEPCVISFECAEYERIIGEKIGEGDAQKILEALGFKVERREGISGMLVVTVPGFRPDVTRPIDIVEELVRVVGLNSIPSSAQFTQSGEAYPLRTEKDLPANVAHTLVPRNIRHWLNNIREDLLAFGFHELLSYSFSSPEEMARFEIPEGDSRSRRAVKIANPLTVEQSMMRTFLLPAFHNAASANLGRRHFDQAFFEIARTYFRAADGEEPEERLKLALWTTGKKINHFSGNHLWDFYDLKGLLEDLFTTHTLSLDFVPPTTTPEPYLHPGVQAYIKANIHSSLGHSEKETESYIVGEIGRLHPKHTSDFPAPVFYAEVDLSLLAPKFHVTKKVEPSSKYQAVNRDFALLVPKNIRWGDIYSSIKNAVDNDSDLARNFRSCEVFDLYEGEQVAEGYYSIAISVTYQSFEKTLTDQEISRYDQLILSALKHDLDLTLRG